MLLKGKKGLIFGALDAQSLAWKIAEQALKEGAEIILSNTASAIRFGTIQELANVHQLTLIPCDITSLEDLESLFEICIKQFGGGIDFILHSVGMSFNLRKNKSYTDLNYDYFQKTLDVSALSLHKVLQLCYNKDYLNPKASVLALSYIASERISANYNDMTEAKALLEATVRHFGYHYGKKNGVRVNAISQSPTTTTAAQGIPHFNEFWGVANQLAPLGNASAEDCANYCMTLFSDYTQKVTMQTLYHDGGFSKTLS